MNDQKISFKARQRLKLINEHRPSIMLYGLRGRTPRSSRTSSSRGGGAGESDNSSNNPTGLSMGRGRGRRSGWAQGL